MLQYIAESTTVTLKTEIDDISGFFGLEFCRLVGDTWKFENAFPLQISPDICKLVVIGETTIYGRGN
jgi:hypothetical protein